MAHYFHMLVDNKTIDNLGGLAQVKRIPGLIRDIVVDFYHEVEKLPFTGKNQFLFSIIIKLDTYFQFVYYNNYKEEENYVFMENTIYIGIGEYRVARNPSILKTILGSCVGVCLYDSSTGIGGVAHVYLPLKPDKELASIALRTDKRYDYADILIPLMIREMKSKGADESKITCINVGGACILAPEMATLLDIGAKNIETVHQILKSRNIPYQDREIRGSKGRTIRFFLEDGSLEINTHA